MKKILVGALILLAAFGAGFVGGNFAQQNLTTGAIATPVASFETSLAATITSSATSMTLVSFETDDGTDLVTGRVYGFTIDEGTTLLEYVIGTAAANNTITDMVRGVSTVTGTTSVTALQKRHGRGAIVKITDAPVIVQITRIINGEGDFPNLVRYATTTSCTSGSASETICNIGYIRNLANAGAATSTETFGGIVELATAAEQASSYYGGVDKPTVLQSRYASSTPSTPQSVSANTTIVSDAAGYLKQAWLNLTEHFIFSSLFATNASSTNATTTNLTVTGNIIYQGATLTPRMFGGTGTDGALAISSGTTTVPLGTNGVYEKNYTSIAITGTGSLNFSSAATSTSGVTVILRSQGTCTFTSSSMTMIDLRWLGGGVANGFEGNGDANGSANWSGGGGGGGGSAAGAGSIGNDASNGPGTRGYGGRPLPALATSTRAAPPGGNGGDGGSGSAGTTGAMGRGAGGLYIECAGGYTFTTGGFMASGANGTNGGSSPGGGGGGGGGGGSILVLFGSLISNTGTYNVTGGSGGSNGGGGGGDAGGGATGKHLEALNTYFY